MEREPSTVETHTILFLHGWGSSPGGKKPGFLQSLGFRVLNPSLCPDDFEEALRAAQQAYDQGHPDLVVGSSRGGAVAMNLKSETTPLLLICPAWKRWGQARTVKSGSLILHSRSDEVIPFSESEELRQLSGLPETSLRDIGKDHRLADPEALSRIGDACRTLLS